MMLARPVAARFPASLAIARVRLAALPFELVPLAIVLALESLLSAAWLAIDSRPPRWDESLYLAKTDVWRHFFLDPTSSTLNDAMTFASWKTPPLWILIMGFVQAVNGAGIDFSVLAS